MQVNTCSEVYVILSGFGYEEYEMPRIPLRRNTWSGWGGLPGERMASVTSSRLPSSAGVVSRLFPKTRSWFALGMPIEFLSPLSLLRIFYGTGWLIWLPLALIFRRHHLDLAVILTAGAISLIGWIALLKKKELTAKGCRILIELNAVILGAFAWSHRTTPLTFGLLGFFAPLCGFVALNLGVRFVITFQILVGLCFWFVLHGSQDSARALIGVAIALFVLSTSSLTALLAIRSVRLHGAIDPETGLPNALGLANQLQTHRTDESLVVACVLLEGVNDAREAIGLRVGTELLRRAVEHLGQVIPPMALIGRVSGDELLVACYLDGSDIEDQARDLADSLTASISKGIFTTNGIALSLRPFVGLATSQAGETDVAQLVRQASLAAQQAAIFRWGHAKWTGETTALKREDLVLLADLRLAIERNELTLAFQPQSETATGKTIAFEALVRWDSPRHGRVEPSRFVPLAERIGLIDLLTEWVLGATLSTQVRLRTQHNIFLPVSVNLSAKSLTKPDLPSWILSELTKRALPTSALSLEVTESAEAVDMLLAVDLLRPLHEEGVYISIDDFGTGYTSFSALPYLPLDELKIDLSFVRRSPTSPPDEAIVRSIGELAHRLGFISVAEGVETDEIKDLMIDIGIDRLQGYCISRPLEESALIEFLRRENDAINALA